MGDSTMPIRARLAGLLLLLGATASAGGDAGEFDVRSGLAPVAPTLTQARALAALARQSAGLRVRWNTRFGTPATLSAEEPLSGPAPSATAGARQWLQANAALFGWNATDVDALAVIKVLRQPEQGPVVVVLHQRYGGLEGTNLGGALVLTLDESNRVWMLRADASRSFRLVAGTRIPAARVLHDHVGPAAWRADGTVAGWLRFAGFGGHAQYARLVALPQPRGAARPAWELVVATAPDAGRRLLVDALDARLLHSANRVFRAAPAGLVIRNHPGAAAGGNQELLSMEGDPQASPMGWFLPGLPPFTTIGNNAATATGWALGGFSVDAGAGAAPFPGELRPVHPSGVFDDAFSDSWKASNCGALPVEPPPLPLAFVDAPSYAVDAPAAVTNLFYHHNLMHDFFYRRGFNEAAGAAQLQNFGRGGEDGDPLIGLAQGSVLHARTDAFVAGGPDGLPIWTVMFLGGPTVATPAPCHDLDFDASIIYHEYAHVVTARMVGGEWLGLRGAQGHAMGEGFSDFFAAHYLATQGLQERPVSGAYGVGNPRRGFRNWAADEVPLNYSNFGYGPRGVEAHADGELWVATLWSLREGLEARDSGTGAAYLAQLAVDALPVAGPGPTLIDMRDALLVADAIRSGGAHREPMWRVFARRGLGASARAVDAADVHPHAAFDHPDPPRNSRLQVHLADATTGIPLAADILVGAFEARVTPVARSSAGGEFELSLLPGRYTLLVRAPGYGVQTLPVTAPPAGQVARLEARLHRNLLSLDSGARVTEGSEPELALALDDSAASAMRSVGTGDRSFTVEIGAGQPLRVQRLQLSAYPANGAGLWEGLGRFSVQASPDGETFTPLVSDAFAADGPWPSAAQLNRRTWILPAPVRARFLRLIAHSSVGPQALAAQIAEFEAFSFQPVTGSTTPTPSLHDEGQVLVSTGVTTPPSATLMAQECAVPVTQGIDAWVTSLPAALGDGRHALVVAASPLTPVPIPGEPGVLFLDAACQFIGAATVQGPELRAPIPARTRWLVTVLPVGLPQAITVHIAGAP